MWDFPGGPTTGNRYLVLGLGSAPAALVRAPDGETARGVLTRGWYAGVELHAGEFGGRP